MRETGETSTIKNILFCFVILGCLITVTPKGIIITAIAWSILYLPQIINNKIKQSKIDKANRERLIQEYEKKRLFGESLRTRR